MFLPFHPQFSAWACIGAPGRIHAARADIALALNVKA